MAYPKQHQRLQNIRQAVMDVLVSLVVLGIIAAQPAQAQTFTVLYSFDTGHGGYGAIPEAGLSMDRGGSLYGTTSTGGPGLSGGVFKLSHKQSGWVYTPLYLFTGGSDGGRPASRVIFGPNGSLYGTTDDGGTSGVGTVFNLQPPVGICKTVSCPWRETVLHSFALDNNGASPEGDLVFDQAGNLYGTLFNGGRNNGAAYELTPSGNGWTESVLYFFPGNGGSGSPRPDSGLVFDNAGNLYGTTYVEIGNGSVYQLSPSRSGWTANTIYTPQGGSQGTNPLGGVILDDLGNLYGTTSQGGAQGGGTVFELTPSNGSWTHTTLYGLSGNNGGPYASLVRDALGNLYGTTYQDGAYGYGSVFKLTPGEGGWTYTSLHDFTGGQDGARPISTLTFDASGNMYGTAAAGGAYNGGVVFEITP